MLIIILINHNLYILVSVSFSIGDYCLLLFLTVLLQHGADPNIRNTDGKSALDLADPSAKTVLTGKTHTHTCFTVITNTHNLMSRHVKAHRVCFCSMKYANTATACCVSAVYHYALHSGLKNEPTAIYSHISIVH